MNTNSTIFGGNYRIIMQSVGKADAGIVGVVQKISRISLQDTARLIYQAPSKLIEGLKKAPANEIAAVLNEAGLSVSVDQGESVFTPGEGGLEVGLIANNLGELPAIIAEVASFLGVDSSTSQRIVCSTPAVLLTNVSAATIDALGIRFARYDVEFDVSRTGDAQYYAVIDANSVAIGPLIRQMVDSINLSGGQAGLKCNKDTFTISPLDYESAQGIWEKLQRTGSKVSICNMDLERYDIQLESAAPSAEMTELLSGLDIPKKLIPKLLNNLPIVIKNGVTNSELESLLARIAELDCTATGIPLSFQRFDLEIAYTPDPNHARQIITSIGALSDLEANNILKGRSKRAGLFSKTTAMWLRRELLNAKCKVDLMLR